MGKTVSGHREANLSKELVAMHIDAYFACAEAERAVMCSLIDGAWREGRDLAHEVLPGGEWRQAWPEAARAAILALWSTPRLR